MAIDTLTARLNAHFGSGTIRPATETAQPIPTGMVPTGIPALDQILGGGLPQGRIVEISSPNPTAGRNTLALATIAEVQRHGGVVALIDMSHTFNLSRAQAAGCNLPRLLIAQPDCAEQALEVTEALIRSTEVCLVVVDALDTLTFKADIEGDTDTAEALNRQAKVLAQAMRKLAATCAKTETTILFLNRTPLIPGGLGPLGSNALKFYASLRLLVSTTTPADAEAKQPQLMKIKVAKSKSAAIFQTVTLPLPLGAPNGPPEQAP